MPKKYKDSRNLVVCIFVMMVVITANEFLNQNVLTSSDKQFFGLLLFIEIIFSIVVFLLDVKKIKILENIEGNSYFINYRKVEHSGSFHGHIFLNFCRNNVFEFYIVR